MKKRNRRLVLKKSLKRITVNLLVLLMMASIFSQGAFASKAANNPGEAIESSQKILSSTEEATEAAKEDKLDSTQEDATTETEEQQEEKQPEEEAKAPGEEDTEALQPEAGEQPDEEATQPIEEAEPKEQENLEEPGEGQEMDIVPYVNGDVLQTADTSGLLQINLFDYFTDGSESSGNVGINKDKTLKFAPGGMSSGPEFNRYSGGLATYPGIVERLLDNGYPKLNFNETASRDSLSYLFSPTVSAEGKSSYQGMNKLFLYDSNSRYYHFDSKVHYARANTANKTFTVYEDSNSKGFFPFNDRTNANINPGQANHYFGLHVKGHFLQPVNGQINKTDGNKENMIFTFTGDDDLWVFIDGVLILDIGGIHGASSGSINFATGDVVINNYGPASSRYPDGRQVTTNIKNLFTAAGKSLAGRNNTFADNTFHSIDVFYLERGNWDSNLKIQFNLDLVHTGNIIVGKELEAEADEPINDKAQSEEYTFTLYKQPEDNNSTVVAIVNTPFDIVNRLGNPIRDSAGEPRKGVTGADGRFSLRAGEYAKFSNMQAYVNYYLEESGLNTTDYKEIKFTKDNGAAVQKAIDSSGKVRSDAFKLIGKDSSVIVTCANVVKENNIMELEIAKKLATQSDNEARTAMYAYGNNSFTMQVYLGESLYKNGSYKLYSTTNGTTWTEIAGNHKTDSLGQLLLKTNEKAVISRLVGGSSFRVVEIGGDDFSRFTVSYRVDGGQSNSNEAEGKLNKASDGTGKKMTLVEVFNKPLSASVAINKIDSFLGTNLEGAEFVIYGNEACTHELIKAVTGSGITTIKGLMVGEVYYMKETKVPVGYEANNVVYKLEITSGNGWRITPGALNNQAWEASSEGKSISNNESYIIENHRSYSILINKEDPRGRDLSEVKFKLERLKNGSIDTTFTSVTLSTDSNGQIEFRNLAAGKYRITEVLAASGHSLLTGPIEVDLPFGDITPPDANAELKPYASKIVEGVTTYYYDRVIYNITNNPKLEVPTTGGSNFYFTGLAGMLLMTIAIGGFVLRKRSLRKIS